MHGQIKPFFVVIAEHAGMLTYLLRPVEYMMCTDRFQYDSFHLLIPGHFSSIKTTLLTSRLCCTMYNCKQNIRKLGSNFEIVLMGIFLDSFTKQIFKSRIRLTIGYGFLGLLIKRI